MMSTGCKSKTIDRRDQFSAVFALTSVPCVLMLATLVVLIIKKSKKI